MLDIGSMQLPKQSATKTFAILAKRGAGKSYTAAVLAEEMFAAGIPFVVFDPIDVWWGLRVAADGRKKGLPIVVFGLEHADIPLERTMGREIAEAIVRENVSCVISTFGMPKNGQRELMADLADELLRINNTPRHIFIEEAHEFVPQRVFGAMGKVFNAVSNLVVMGRNRGLGVTLINQRAATLNKDVLTQVDTLLAFRNVAPQDRKALREWVEFHAAEGDFDRFMQSLPSLPTGEGWIWSPEFLEVFERVKIRERTTFHPDRERLGEDFVMPEIAQGDIESFIAKFNKPPKGTEVMVAARSAGKTSAMNEFKELKRENEELKTTIKEIAAENDSELAKKDKLIESLEEKLRKIAAIASNGQPTEAQPINQSSGKVEMWADKLPGGPAKIIRFLAEKHPMKFTRSQLALANGIRLATLTKNVDYLPALKRNNLIEEHNGLISLHKDLV